MSTMQKMDQYYYYRWMYDRTFSRRTKLKPQFEEGIHGFVAFAMSQNIYEREEGIRCLCLTCTCRLIQSGEDVIKHLKKVGFMDSNWVWTNHGEQMPPINIGFDVNTHASCNGTHTENVEQFDMMDDMIGDALGVNMSYDEPVEEELPPNKKAQDFYNLLEKINELLFEGSNDSKLSMCARLLAAKSDWNVPDKCLEHFVKMLLDATPIKDNLPKSYYEAQRFVSKLGLESKRIDCCSNDACCSMTMNSVQMMVH